MIRIFVRSYRIFGSPNFSVNSLLSLGSATGYDFQRRVASECQAVVVNISCSQTSKPYGAATGRRWRLWLLACLCCGFMVNLTAAEDIAIQEANQKDAKVSGSLVIIGGSERYNNREYWEEIVELAGGPGARIAVFPTASGDPVKKGGWVITALNKAGADAFLVPVAWKKLDRTPVETVSDPDLVAQVRESTGVFLIGGAQDKIVKALFQADGKHTPMLDAIWEVYRKGGVIAGTSAGAAVMSRVMYRDAGSVLDTMLHGVRWGKEIDRGLGFIDENWFVDQHLFVRGRFART